MIVERPDYSVYEIEDAEEARFQWFINEVINAELERYMVARQNRINLGECSHSESSDDEDTAQGGGAAAQNGPKAKQGQKYQVHENKHINFFLQFDSKFYLVELHGSF